MMVAALRRHTMHLEVDVEDPRVDCQSVRRMDQICEREEKPEQEERLLGIATLAMIRHTIYLEANADDCINTLLLKALCDITHPLVDPQVNCQNVERMN